MILQESEGNSILVDIKIVFNRKEYNISMNNAKKVTLMYYEMFDKQTGYKLLETNDINKINCEQGINKFSLYNCYEVIIDGIKYYFVINKSKKIHFGEVLTLKELLKDERVSREDKEIVKDIAKNPNRKFFLNTNNEIEMYFNDIELKPNRIIPFDKTNIIEASQVLFPSYEWYIEYTKHNEEETYLKPTFYSDKIYRYDPIIDKYRFVKVAKIKDNEKENIIPVEKEKEWHISENSYTRDEVDDAIDSSIAYIVGKSNQPNMFEGYTRLYPFNTENSSAVFAINKEYIENNAVLSITGSGDAPLDLFLNGAKTVTCFDINGLAKFLAVLKFSFIKAGISYEEYVNFFSADPRKFEDYLDFDIYEKYSDNILDENAKKYWDNIIRYLEINNISLKKDKNTLFYNAHDALFGLFTNSSFSVKGSYLENEESFKRLQDILKQKSIKDLTLVDASLFDIDKVLEGKKYKYIYLSNVLDFSDYYFNDYDYVESKEKFKEYIVNNLSALLDENGLIDVSYVKDSWSLGNIETTLQVFSTDEGYNLQSLVPYSEDRVLSITSSELVKSNKYRK